MIKQVQKEVSVSDGSSADYYKFPLNTTKLQDLINFKQMNFNMSQLFRHVYIYNGQLDKVNSMMYNIDNEISRLQTGNSNIVDFINPSQSNENNEVYIIPPKAQEVQDLISYRNMNGQMAEIFRAIFRYGEVGHSPKLRDAKKIKFYLDAEIKRLTTDWGI